VTAIRKTLVGWTFTWKDSSD